MFLRPFENSSAPVCDAVDLALASMPPASDAFRNANLAMCIVFAGLFYGIILPAAWVLRDHQQFKKVRPVWITFVMATCGTVCGASVMLRMYVSPDYPCALLVIGMFFTMQGLGAVFNLRGLIFVVEHVIQKKLKSTQSRLIDLESDSGDTARPSISALRAILRVGFGYGQIDELDVLDLAQVKQPAFLLFILGVFTFIAVVPICILFAVHPALVLCNGCPLFSEIVIANMAVLIPQTLCLTRITWVGYRSGASSDESGVIQEFIGVLCYGNNLAMLGSILELADPDDVDKNNIFAWEWLIFIGGLLIALYTSVIPIVVAVKQIYYSRKNEAQIHLLDDQSMLDVITNDNDEVGKEFEKFAARCLVVELVHFVRDVHTYNKYFLEKGDSWRVQKTKLLVNLYINVGASAEVNISENTRSKIQERHISVTKGAAPATSLQGIFDDANREVVKMLEYGAWPRFIKQKPGRNVRLMQRDSKTIGRNAQIAPHVS